MQRYKSYCFSCSKQLYKYSMICLSPRVSFQISLNSTFTLLAVTAFFPFADIGQIRTLWWLQKWLELAVNNYYLEYWSLNQLHMWYIRSLDLIVVLTNSSFTNVENPWESSAILPIWFIWAFINNHILHLSPPTKVGGDIGRVSVHPSICLQRWFDFWPILSIIF